MAAWLMWSCSFTRVGATRQTSGTTRFLAELREFAATLGINDLQPWDTSYVSENSNQQKHTCRKKY